VTSVFEISGYFKITGGSKYVTATVAMDEGKPNGQPYNLSDPKDAPKILLMIQNCLAATLARVQNDPNSVRDQLISAFNQAGTKSP